MSDVRHISIYIARPPSEVYAFASDPSQQMALMGGDDIKQLVDGATYLFKMDEDAQVYVNDMHAQLEDLRRGDRVQVIYRVDEHDLLALEIRCRR